MKRDREISDLNSQLFDRMGEIAVIDCLVDGDPFYIIKGGSDCNGWSPQAEKVRQLYIKAHPIRYWLIKLFWKW